jgi:homoserine O-acetyltransferase
MVRFKAALAACLLAFASVALADGDQQFGEIGDLKLESGATLQKCRVGYRTFGNLDANKDNVVLVPTWYLGKTADLAGSFGRGGLVDSSKYYVIAVDALGNSVSSSPSNSTTQHDALFPDITVRDMVESQHQLLLKLGIHHLRAVLGISMGGIQTFQWITTYPDFMDAAVPIVGSPRPTSYDLALYTSGLKAIRSAIDNVSARPLLIRTFADYFYLSLTTPNFFAQHVKLESAVPSLSGFESGLLAWDPYDMATDMSALCANDAYKAFGDDQAKAAAAVHAKVLVVVASQDHCVNPASALEFAKVLGAQTMILTNDLGHSSPGAEMARISPAIDKLLSPG